MRLIALLLSFALFSLVSVPNTAAAQARSNTILVLDGSGSMWGQIDGINKIVIAREVVARILSDFPADQNLGLTVYGHRTRGDCSDIETVVTPGIDNRDAILDAVNAINPRGMTPMTDSVTTAAEALRFTETAATVILVSDGIETCNPDPCAAARVLEETGVDFTAHVVGFDVTEADALAQMQCIADETGGEFLTASNADELATALTQVATAPEPEPEPIVVTGTFSAVLDTDSAPLVDDPVEWTVASDSAVLVQDSRGNPLTLDLLEGTYRATAYRLVDEMSLDTTFTVTGDAPVDISIAFPVPLPQATLMAPDTAPAGSRVAVEWTGPDDTSDNIQIAEVGGDAVHYIYTSSGTPASLQLPAAPGDYELRYVWRDRDTIATRPITVTEIEIGLDAPETVVAGSEFQVGWTGPDATSDNIQIGTPDGAYSSWEYTAAGNPVTLTAPNDAGTYELRYRFLDNQTIFTRPITVTEVQGGLTAPDVAIVGETITVGWDGPGYERDFISVGEPGETNYVNYTYIDEGNPLQLVMPPRPGTYEIRYQLRQGSEVLVTRPITIEPAEATVTAPATATVGETLTVEWTGPAYERDFIAVGEVGATNYVNYTYVDEGSPLSLVMPSEAGTYEIRYQLRQGNTVLVTQPITVTEAQASVTAPDSAPVGETVTVEWTGPAYERDFIAVGEVGATNYANYTYVDEGSPLSLVMPTQPGTYEIRYQLRQGNEVIATRPITITALKVDLVAPETANAGETVSVEWTGPGYERDFISVGRIGETNYINYTYVQEGNPVSLVMPSTPGDYEIRYQLRQGNEVMQRVFVTVAPVSAQLVAPSSVSLADGSVLVGWDGPGYNRDFVGISRPGEDGYLSYAYTDSGNPVSIRLPDEAGTYELRYFLGQGNVVVATLPLTVTE